MSVQVKLFRGKLIKDSNSLAEPADEPLPMVERTQTDRINSNLLKSFLNRLNTDSQFESTVTQGQRTAETEDVDNDDDKAFN